MKIYQPIIIEGVVVAVEMLYLKWWLVAVTKSKNDDGRIPFHKIIIQWRQQQLIFFFFITTPWCTGWTRFNTFDLKWIRGSGGRGEFALCCSGNTITTSSKATTAIATAQQSNTNNTNKDNDDTTTTTVLISTIIDLKCKFGCRRIDVFVIVIINSSSSSSSY